MATPASTIAARLSALRAAMAQRQLDACVFLTADPHLSEYLPDHWQGRAWLSGFEGSAGTLVVTASQAALWTDSRYWEQAEGELAGTGIAVMRAGALDVPGPSAWAGETLVKGGRVCIDARTLSLSAHRQWQNALRAHDIALVTDQDVLADVWRNRPALPCKPVYEHLPPHACRTRAENLAGVRAGMREQGADWHWLSSLDDIAWLFNLRGSDVSYNPVFLAHALIGADEARLFVAPGKIGDALREQLGSEGVQVLDYEDAPGVLASLPENSALLVDPDRCTASALAAAAYVRIIESLNPSQRLKSRKNTAEADNVRAVMAQDGAALCEFFAWLEANLGRERITEISVDEQICAARARRPGFVTPSFGTIAAYNANGAMPHYHATPEAHAVIEGSGLLLIDSGGQYLGGTTDITRVVPIGTPSEAQKRDYTYVLKGMIALSCAVFPRGTPAPMLDVLARNPIWQAGGEYGHGTGHGVGYFLNVHEGPQSISYRAQVNPDMAFLPGMITSNEPGLYRPGRWGIRIENLVLTVPAMETEFGEFLRFETLTLCPIDTRCIDAALLTQAECDWLNAYHAQVRERLAPLVRGEALDWLHARTAAL
ncbi:aminopeptidase P family protein [Allopusillimonas soli]|uniref:Aminopeptidase P family protein n=1 Tax=Allopusillimonas soli TaxID=659016 RepID=A0A853FJW2_9BURK|nr:aminopeptidase P family protein [Allopusillimonas soli]NYT39020.1 aminopeptidase P family protein [Allopusillimonas soli]TEA69542.1 aminopeptidase P family protein [Allopusillimonas soli]